MRLRVLVIAAGLLWAVSTFLRKMMGLPAAII
jgi:hypothetical protein